MSIEDFNQILVVGLLIVLIISIIILVIQISRSLTVLELILNDTHNVSSKISDMSDHPEKLQEATKNYVTGSIDGIVSVEVEKIRKSIAQDFLGGIIDYLRKSK